MISTTSGLSTTAEGLTTTGAPASVAEASPPAPLSSLIRRGGDDYAEAFAALLPTGAAWPRDPQSALMQLVSGLGRTWGGIDGRAADLLERETDPRATIEFLSEWERAFGLPERSRAYVPAATRFRIGSAQVGRDALMRNDRRLRVRKDSAAPATLDERRDALLTKMTSLGGQSRAFFVGIAAALGYQITIAEFSPFAMGISQLGDTRAHTGKAVWFRCGQSRCGTDHHLRLPSDLVVTGDARWRLGRPDNRFVWRVNVSGFRASWFRAGSGRLGIDRLLKISPRPERFAFGRGELGIDPLLRVGRAEDLETVFRRLKPAHSHVVFNYAQVST